MEPGFLLIDKPQGWTSHDAVNYVRKVSNTKKVGHAGTLDPFATGLLIVAIGRPATKQIDRFRPMQKIYETTIRFGAISETQDVVGPLIKTSNPQWPTDQQINDVLPQFTGEIQQIPPMHSAKKIGGKKLYELARKGETIERKPHTVTIHNIERIDSVNTPAALQDGRFDPPNEHMDFPTLSLRATCSSGTYIRTIAHDIGDALGVGAYCETLRRTAIGNFSVTDAVTPKQLDPLTLDARLLSSNILDEHTEK